MAENVVEITLDDRGRVVGIPSSPDRARLAGDLAEGGSLESHIHPDDYDFFLWSAQWIANGPGRRKTIPLCWAQPGGGWSTFNATLAGEENRTITVTLRPDELEQSRRTEAQLRRVVEGSAQGIVVRTGSDILFVNEAYAHMLGFSSTHELSAASRRDTSAGRAPRDCYGAHPDDRALVAEHMRKRLAGEEFVSHYEFRLLRSDGSILWVETHAAVADWDGQTASLSWVSDISHHKTLENELIRSRDAAEESTRAKAAFLANMSHELRTPLNAIIGFAEVIKDELFGPVGITRYAEYACDIHTSGRHLLDLINDILDHSKLEAGKHELRDEVFPLDATIRDCITLVRDRAQKSAVSIEVGITPNLPAMRGDPRAIKQILLNFLSNAIKFTPSGGAVAVRAAEVDDSIALSVTDTGIGMSKEDIKVALSAFGQVDSKIGRQHQGTGLGLPISKSLIELHGGRLQVESHPGTGTTMTAIFPSERTVLTAA